MESIIDDALNYQKYIHQYGTYQLTRITQQSGSMTMNNGTPLQLNGGDETIFEIPPKVFNCARSSIRFTVTVPIPPNTKFNWVYTDGIMYFRQIQFLTRLGTYLVDLNDADRYSNMVLRRETKFEDYITWDKPGGTFEGLAESNCLAAANLRPNLAGGGTTNYLEPQYVTTGVVGTGVAGIGAVTINVRFDLDRLKNSLFAEDKDLFFNGEILNIRLVWAPATKMYFTNDNATASLNPAAPTAGVQISNLLLLLALETNPQVENMVKAKCASAEGLQILTPMIFYNRAQLQSLNQTISVKYSRAHGMKLQKIYWAPYNQTESLNTAFDHNNIAANMVSQFYTQVNNIRTSQYDYNTYNPANTFIGDDYTAKKDSLRGSCILSSNEYYFNWVWIEDFTDNNPLFKDLGVPEENCIQGLDLTNEIKYDINSITAGNTLNHYVYAVTQKLLVVSPAGITFS
jgi:hypothetical protein